MSTIRDPAIITAQGRQMMTAGGDISYTKAVLFGQDISHLTKEQLEGLTSIGNPLMTVTVGISDKSINNNGTTVSLEATFQNSGLKADLPYTAVGFFARKGDDTEKLVILGIANSGAYLAAASPDGVATDALDVKVAISIGDATSVTAVVDPAGSVTPAALNGAINKLDHDISAKIDANQDSTEKALDTKSDKATVESDLATKANQSDLDKTNATVETKADKTDVASSVKQLQDSIATKADAKTVNDAISKIDFTPYAKSVDVYSKAELDKKLLALSTDTDGKVNADQVANMIEGKADKTDVNAKIKAVTDLANTKADASDVYTKADVNGKTSGTIITAFDVASKTPTEEIGAYNHRRLVDQGVLGQFADAINAVNGTNTRNDAVDVNTLEGVANKVTVYRLTNDNNKNTPSWIGDQRGIMIVLNYDGNAKTQIWTPVGGSAKDSTGTFGWRYWEGNNPPAWNRFASVAYVDNRHNDLQNQINANDRVTLTTGYNWNTGTPTNESRTLQNAWIVDQMVLKGAVDRMNSLQDQINDRATNSKVNVAASLFRRIQNSNTWKDIFGVADGNQVLTSLRIDAGGSGALLNNYSSGIGFGGADTKGVLSVAYQNHQARITGGNGAGPVWSEDVAWKSDINDLRNQVQQLRENQFEVQTFTDATAAANWEAQRQGKRMAIVNK